MKRYLKLLRSVIIFLFTIILFEKSLFAQINVKVSENFSSIHFAKTFTLAPSQMEVSSLFLNGFNDEYVAFYKVSNTPVQVLVIDNKDISNNNPNPVLLVNKSILDEGMLLIPKITSSSGFAFTVINKSQSVARVQLTIFRIGKRPIEALKPIKERIEVLVSTIAKFYHTPAFDVFVTPCGISNAVSTPDIFICTELISDLAERNFPYALEPIVLHEMAHSLLLLWKLPGYNNEDFADEFAAVILAKSNPHYINDFQKWLLNNDSINEAVIQLVNGDRHTISIQRARNTQSLLSNPTELIERWNKLLSPFAKKYSQNQ